MKLLFIASAAMEFPGILAHSDQVRRVELPVHWARSARFGGNEVLLVANGAGARRAAAAVDAALEGFRPDAVINMGFCGALDPELAVAEIVIADCIAGEGRNYPARAFMAAPAHRTGMIRSAGRVAQTAVEKLRLHATGAIAVEMEAAGVAERAQIHSVPFYCVRAVTDLAGETMANDFNSALRSDGQFDTIVILRGIFCQPSVRLPELLRLRRRCGRAACALGDFFADCRL